MDTLFAPRHAPRPGLREAKICPTLAFHFESNLYRPGPKEVAYSVVPLPSPMTADSIVSRVPRSFDRALEGLRGLACLTVLFCHLTTARIVDPVFDASWYSHGYILPGLEAVLIFFLISGYVIGINYGGAYSREAARDYGWKRLVRLAPLNFLALVLSVAIFPIDGISTILSNIFFLGNWEPYFFFRLPPLKANPNLWSLNFELLYYSIFLLFWKYRIKSPKLIKLMVFCLIFGLTGWLLKSYQPKILTCYAVGAVFWCTGLWLAWYGKPVATTNPTGNRFPWVSVWLLFLATWQFDALYRVLDFAGFGWVDHPHVSFVNLDVFPLGLIILAGATAREIPWPRFWWSLALAQPITMLLWNLATRGAHFLAVDHLGAGSLMTLLALLAFPWRMSDAWLKTLFPIGLISYGIYIFQWPAIHFVHGCFPDFAGTPLTYLVRFGAIVLLTLLFSYVGERLFQPWIKRVLQRFYASRIQPGKVTPAAAQVAP